MFALNVNLFDITYQMNIAYSNLSLYFFIHQSVKEACWDPAFTIQQPADLVLGITLSVTCVCQAET